jgi:threonine dehydrogenase-like Zn-dependent dehydrogenase
VPDTTGSPSAKASSRSASTADISTYLLPETTSDEEALMLAGILPTAYEVGVERRSAAGRHGGHRGRRPNRSDVTVRTGLVGTFPTLLRFVTSRQLDAARFIAHRFSLDEVLDAYDVFQRAKGTGALKVVLSRP